MVRYVLSVSSLFVGTQLISAFGGGHHGGGGYHPVGHHAGGGHLGGGQRGEGFGHHGNVFAFHGGGGFAVRGGEGGMAYGHADAGYHVGPAGGFYGGEDRYRSYETPRGTTVQAGEAGGIHDGPYGLQAGREDGVRVTTPSGQTYSAGNRDGIAAGPYGVRAGDARGFDTTGPYGSAGYGSRAGYDTYRGGVAVGGYHAGAAYGGYGAAVVGHSTAYVSPTHLNSWGAAVRTGYAYPYFGAGWVTSHPLAWSTARWATAGLWAVPTWAAASAFLGLAAADPIPYDYGANVVITNNTVYQDGNPVASADDYAAQAITIADQGRQTQPTDADDWQALGVFGLVQGDEKVAQRIFQLATDRSGVVRGNYYDAVADNNLPIYGSVDKQSQRVAWSVGQRKDVVFETGLNNLTKPQSSVLVHYGKDKTQQMTLVRLDEPKDGK